jgi:hypothetical protein
MSLLYRAYLRLILLCRLDIDPCPTLLKLFQGGRRELPRRNDRPKCFAIRAKLQPLLRKFLISPRSIRDLTHWTPVSYAHLL